MAGPERPPVMIARGLGKRFTIEIPEERTVLKDLQRWFQGGGPRRELWALRGVDLDLPPGEALGVIGPNGSGKSTLLALAAGLLVPTEGTVEVKGAVQPFFRMGSGLHAELSVEDNMRLCAALLGFSERDVESRFEDILEYSELGEYRRACLGELSTGLASRIPFSVGLFSDLDLLLIDEMFLVGDASFRMKCLDSMLGLREAGKSFVLVSHDLDLIRYFCPRCVRLENGRLIDDGPSSAVTRAYARHHIPSGAGSGRGDTETALFRERVRCWTRIGEPLMRTIVESGWAELVEAEPIDRKLATAAHSKDWLDRALEKERRLQKQLGPRWHPDKAPLFSLRDAGATLAACRGALEDGLAVFPGGGRTLASSDSGRRFDAVNDVAVALKRLLAEREIRRPLVVDLNADPGDGTSDIFAGDDHVYTFSIHEKSRTGEPSRGGSSRGVGLPDSSEDDAYLEVLRKNLEEVFDWHKPDLVVFVAGVDSFAGDPTGGLKLSAEGLLARDRLVLQECRARRLPVAVCFGRGYSQPRDLLALRLNTVKAAFEALGRRVRVYC